MRLPEQITEPRINFNAIGKAVLQQLSLEKGLGFTIKAILFTPGKALKEYLFTDRKKYTKPFPFLLLFTGIATFISLNILPIQTDFPEGFTSSKEYLQLPEQIRQIILALPPIITKYFNLLLLSNIPAFSIASYLVFKDSDLNLAEHLIINCYINAIQTLLFIISLPFIINFEFLGPFFILLFSGYMLFAYLRVFEQKLGVGLIKFVYMSILSQLFIAIAAIAALILIYIFIC